MTWTRCWCGLDLGSGAEGLILRFFSRPPFVLVYCHARIIEGGKAMMRGLLLNAVQWKSVESDCIVIC